jgi:phage terminase small subunit
MSEESNKLEIIHEQPIDFDVDKSIDSIENEAEEALNNKLRKLIELRNHVSKNLAPRHFQFVREYFFDFNAKKAAVRTGYQVFYGTELMQKNEWVKAYVRITQKINEISIGITTEQIAIEYNKIAKIKISDLYDPEGNILHPSMLPDHVAAAISEVKQRSITVEGKTYSEITYKLHNKMAALEALGKHVGFFEKDNAQKGFREAPVTFVLPDNGRQIQTEDEKS